MQFRFKYHHINVLNNEICACLLLFSGAASYAQEGSVVGWGSQVVGVDLSGDYVSVFAGYAHSLGLKNNGSIVAWGYNEHGQCDVPHPNTSFTAIATNNSHNLGLKDDGSIVAWGRNDYGQCDVPEPNTGFVAVAAGFLHSLGLKDDSSIVAWGRNNYGQCNVPEPNTGFVTIATSNLHGIATKGSDCNKNGILDYLDIINGTSLDINGNGVPDECECLADLTGDDQVNVEDIFAVLGLWGECPDPCPPYCAGDLTEDCTVNIDDIFTILGEWGECE